MSLSIERMLFCEDLTNKPDGKEAFKFIGQEYEKILNMEVKGTFGDSISAKNTQNEVEEICFDSNLVILSEETGSNNRINASYIDGFKHPKAYIATKTPNSEKAIYDFWKMIWDNQTELIVMLNKPDGREKGEIYWNSAERTTLYCGNLSIETLKVQPIHASFEMTKLIVTHVNGGSLLVDHFLYKNWQRVNIFPRINDFLELITMVRLYNRHAGTINSYKRPIVVHCSDGLERSIVFCAIDIAISQILKSVKVNFFSIFSKLKKERFNCLRNECHYHFCNSVLYHYFMFFMDEQ